MNQDERLRQISTAILTLCLENKRLSGVHVADLINSFSNKREAKDVLRKYLVKMDYVRSQGDDQYYKITALGRAYLSQSPSSSVNYSNITNSNIAHQSSNVEQSVEVAELSDDLKELLNQFDSATQKKDSAAMKKIFGYILDKSVDVGIALVTGSLVR